jgi:Ser-tRNA(Ala) deacylase AlaX
MRLSECQSDSYRRALSVTVTSCVASDGGFHVETDRSILFPGGGGQPEDFGWINEVPVRPDGEPQGDGYGFSAVAPVALGAQEMKVDWSRRFDHMQQHTAQHVLTAVALEAFGWSTLSFHLNADRSDIVVDQAGVSRSDLKALESRVNQVIRDRRSVGVREMSRAEVEAGEARYRRLPDAVVDTLRLIEIDGVDLNPCGGTHVDNTAELQCIRLVSASSEKGARTRIHFLAGMRVLEQSWALSEREVHLRTVLSCGGAEQIAAVERIIDREKGAARHVRALEAELAGYVAREMIESDDGVVGVYRIKAGPEFVNTIARRLEQEAPEKLAVVSVGDSTGVFSVLGPEAVVSRVSAVVCGVMDGRGGGRGRRFQGKAAEPARIDAALSAVRLALEEAE